ncbi:uncharacterized protein [Montipora capricornis]|uniref:uncharacterized protein isoform X2 n=1 Tax=Montipora capricornis TaxID=246305 RepID=UPI0035F1CE0A
MNIILKAYSTQKVGSGGNCESGNEVYGRRASQELQLVQKETMGLKPEDGGHQCDSKGSSKTGTRQSHGDSGDPQMANSGVVLNGYENADKLPSPSAAQCQTTFVTQPPTKSTSITQETGPFHLLLIREQLHASGLSQAASDIILCTWRNGTKKQYRTYLSKWGNYCSSKGISPVSATVAQAISQVRCWL